MLWKTHIRITNEIINQLKLSKSSHEANRLRQGSIDPDRWKDNSHDKGKSSEIKHRLLKSRKSYLKNELPDAYYNLGVALHYIQDKYTTLTPHPRHHNKSENQIQQAYFTYDLESLIEKSFQNNSEQKKEYLKYIEILSNDVIGKTDTLNLASLRGPRVLNKNNRKFGNPYVDLNIACKVSLIIAKSVLGKKTNNALQQKVKNIQKFYEKILVKTEMSFVEEIIGINKKIIDFEKRKEKNGIFKILLKNFLFYYLRKYDSELHKKLRDYETQKHLEKIIYDYISSVEEEIFPHRDWFNIFIPQIDINIVKNELVTLSEASQIFNTKGVLNDLIRKKDIFKYRIENKEYLRRSEVEKLFDQKR